MKFVLGTPVEVDDATFWFLPCAGVEAEIAAFYKQHAAQAENGEVTYDLEADTVPPEIAALFEKLFVQACRRWIGVEDEDGKPLECTTATREAAPTEVKLRAVLTYFAKLTEAGVTEAKGTSGDAPPTPPSGEGE